MIQEIIEKLENVVDKCLEAAAMDSEEIDHVILMGGSTRIPAVRNLICDKFGEEKILDQVLYDEGIALGATKMAAILSG